MTMIERYRRWLDYEADAHSKTLQSLETVSPENRSTTEFQRAISLFGHLVAARRLWLFRLGILPTPPATFFPTNLELSQIAQQWQETHQQWADYLAGLTNKALDQVFEYQSSDSGRFRNVMEDILTQLFGHSWYHRGQIAMLVRQAGGQPVVTDFIFWCREPI